MQKPEIADSFVEKKEKRCGFVFQIWVSKKVKCFTSLFGQYGHLSENSKYYNIPYCIVKVAKERQS